MPLIERSRNKLTRFGYAQRARLFFIALRKQLRWLSVAEAISLPLKLMFNHRLFNRTNRFGWAKVLRANLHTIHNGMTTIKFIRIIQLR